LGLLNGRILMRARLYYEAHVTVEDSGVDWPEFAAAARHNGWRASRFSEDEVDDMSGKLFLSARDQDLATITGLIDKEVRELEDAGLRVLRWKIEDTVADSKHGDLLEEVA
jgi:hypothetical protein